MRIGYARVSTGEQKLDLQLDALGAANYKKTYTDTDTISGAIPSRPEPG
jgi:DNA invertase Pin-like site-specific DNA recombinase